MHTRHDGSEIRGRCAGKLVSKEGRNQEVKVSVGATTLVTRTKTTSLTVVSLR